MQRLIPVENTIPERSLYIYDTAGRVGRFTQSWLRANLEQAARTAACDPAPLVEDVSTAVSEYLQRLHLHSIIRLGDFTDLMRNTLRSIGYPEVARVLRITHPVKQVSLRDCLCHLPAPSEAAFFDQLQLIIEGCRREGGQRLEFSHLAACADLLQSPTQAFPWHRATGARRKIVTFIRRQIARSKWREPLYCSIR